MLCALFALKSEFPMNATNLLLYLIISLPQIAETAYSPILPQLAASFSVSSASAQWTLSLYFIGFAFGVFIWGTLADRLGRKNCLIAGLNIFVVAAIGNFLVSHFTLFLFTRLLQGFGAATCSIIVQTMVRDNPNQHACESFFSYVGIVLAVSIAAGPLLGSLCLSLGGPHILFLSLVGIGLVLLLLSQFMLNETHTGGAAANVTQTLSDIATDVRVLACLSFVAIVNGILFSFYAEAPFLLYNLLHATAWQFACGNLLIAAGAGLGGIGMRLYGSQLSVTQRLHWGTFGTVLISGLLYAVTASGLLNQLSSNFSIWLIFSCLFGIVLFGFGLMVPTALSIALEHYRDRLGTAGAAMSLGYYLGISGITFLMSLLHDGSLLAFPQLTLGLSITMLLIYIGLCYHLDTIKCQRAKA